MTRVEHVPLGWSTAWRPHRDLLRLIKDKDIPILFYGTLTPRRKRTLQMLRSNGLPIFHANAQTDGTFAPALDALILSASIILDLKAFDSTHTREWKMPRLAKLLAAGAFVVSEGACGVSTSVRRMRRASSSRTTWWRLYDIIWSGLWNGRASPRAGRLF